MSEGAGRGRARGRAAARGQQQQPPPQATGRAVTRTPAPPAGGRPGIGGEGGPPPGFQRQQQVNSYLLFSVYMKVRNYEVFTLHGFTY